MLEVVGSPFTNLEENLLKKQKQKQETLFASLCTYKHFLPVDPFPLARDQLADILAADTAEQLV